MHVIRAGKSVGLALVLVLASSGTGNAQPTQVSYQGQLLVNGSPYTGPASMKFAIMSGTTTLWSNDGKSVPTDVVPLTVSNGTFAVVLGATPMPPLGASVFSTTSSAILRVWANTPPGSGFQQLTDQQLSSVPFALQSGALRAEGATLVTLTPGQTSPDAGHVTFGDGTGWVFSFERRTDANTVMSVSDRGRVRIYGQGTNEGECTVYHQGQYGYIQLLTAPEGGTFRLAANTPSQPALVKAYIANSASGPGAVDVLDQNGRTTHIGGDAQIVLTNSDGKTIQLNAISGVVTTPVLEITGGSDLAEPFTVGDAIGAGEIRPGVVVSIDPEHPGALRPSSEPYDSRVAGVLSGANGIRPGMVMRSAGRADVDGKRELALTGRVYVWASACNGRIEPGDLLTSSRIPGHAMKATDKQRRQGAVIGKAMSGLQEGEGLVLVLVQAQ